MILLVQLVPGDAVVGGLRAVVDEGGGRRCAPRGERRLGSGFATIRGMDVRRLSTRAVARPCRQREAARARHAAGEREVLAPPKLDWREAGSAQPRRPEPPRPRRRRSAASARPRRGPPPPTRRRAATAAASAHPAQRREGSLSTADRARADLDRCSASSRRGSPGWSAAPCPPELIAVRQREGQQRRVTVARRPGRRRVRRRAPAVVERPVHGRQPRSSPPPPRGRDAAHDEAWRQASGSPGKKGRGLLFPLQRIIGASCDGKLPIHK